MEPRTRPDPHSYFEAGGPVIKGLQWEIDVDFTGHTLQCVARLRFDRSGTALLDTRDLAISRITGDPREHPKELAWHLDAAEPILGSRLVVELPEGQTIVNITYETSPNASGLQWLTPEQTAGKEHPFVFSQGEQLNTRSFLPCQDTPQVRFVYDAWLKVPRPLQGVMAARRNIHYNDTVDNEGQWMMDCPIPSYLVAFAVGNMESREIGPRSSVWAEPELVAQAAVEFAEVPQFMEAAEKLLGPYLWGRFDLLFLPPSFPYGGMENPTLTFLSPTLIVGDRSMAYVAIHELVHAWLGNLITNATWNDFWLNEGWTTWGERRLSEILLGIPETRLEAALLEREFLRDCVRFDEEGRPEFTRLLTTMGSETDPDEAFSRVPYHKGAWFLEVLEAAVGRPAFDQFVRGYIETFKFRSLTTHEFLAYFERKFPCVLTMVGADEWINGNGLPASAPPIVSDLMEEAKRYTTEGAVPPQDVSSEWIAPHVALFLELFPRDQATAEVCRTIQERFGLGPRGSSDVQWTWLLLAVESGNHALVADHLKAFLGSVGRVKYLKPLYIALVHAGLVDVARALYEENMLGYHPIAQTVVETVLKAA